MQARSWLASVCCWVVLAAFPPAPPMASGGTFPVADADEMKELMVRVRATQFLQRATFGPTVAEIDSLTAQMMQDGVVKAASDWIDNQFTITPSLHEARHEEMRVADGWPSAIEEDIYLLRYRHHAFWDIACRGEDQLRQRVAWALAQIVVTSEDGSNFNNAQFSDQSGQQRPFHLGVVNYYDMLVQNADQTYLDVLKDVAFHPVMGVYLSHVRNKKADVNLGTFPDENFAREIMQLFSIGLYQLNNDGTYVLDETQQRIPTYDNETVKELARLFTGMTYAGNNNINFGRPDLHRPMILLNQWHDAGDKTLFNGQVLPGNADGAADIRAGIDMLYEHANVAPFISRLLIQRLVRSNPSRGYMTRVSRVFNDNGSGVKGDLKAVVKAILLDREAWDSIRTQRLNNPLRVMVSSNGTERSRMIEPVVMYAGFTRRFATGSTYENGGLRIGTMEWDWQQSPYKSPTVFNFYMPNFQPAGPITTYTASNLIPNREIYAPEFQLLSSVVVNRMANRYRWEINEANSRHWPANTSKTGQLILDIPLDFAKYDALGNDPVALVAAIDLDLCNGTMSDEMRAMLVQAINDDTNSNPINRSRAALTCVVLSPAYLISQ